MAGDKIRAPRTAPVPKDFCIARIRILAFSSCLRITPIKQAPRQVFINLGFILASEPTHAWLDLQSEHAATYVNNKAYQTVRDALPLPFRDRKYP